MSIIRSGDSVLVYVGYIGSRYLSNVQGFMLPNKLREGSIRGFDLALRRRPHVIDFLPVAFAKSIAKGLIREYHVLGGG